MSTQSASMYTVTIVGLDGKVVASAQASTPTTVSCAGTAAAVVPLPVSTSNTRVYYMDAQGVVRWLGPDGKTDVFAYLPAPTSDRRSMFAASPDDQDLAVVVDTFSATGASTRLYMQQINQTLPDIFTESGSYTIWPVGWHGINNLVLAKVVSCTQGGGPFCCGPLELHVVDPATATRRFTIGSSSGCVIAGPPSTAGAVCENTPGFVNAQEMNWTGGVIGSFQISGPSPAFISPDGNSVAVVDYAGGITNVRVGGSVNMLACDWIDSLHLLSGGDAQHQPRVADLTKGVIYPVAAQGDCGGRIPGGL